MVRLREALARQLKNNSKCSVLKIWELKVKISVFSDIQNSFCPSSAEYVLTRLHHLSISLVARGVYSRRRLGTIHNTA